MPRDLLNQFMGRAEDLCVTGTSVYGNITLPPRHHQHEAFRSPPEVKATRLSYATFSTTQLIRVQHNQSGMIRGSWGICPDVSPLTIEFGVGEWCQPHSSWWFDVINRSDQEASVGCFIFVQVIHRFGDMPDVLFEVAHVETPEERRAREQREIEAARIRLVSEATAWNELTQLIGEEAANSLKDGYPYQFRGSNGVEYAVDYDGNITNVTTGRQYCVVFRGGELLPLPDIIMGKINWLTHNAEEVERVKNDTGAGAARHVGV